MDPQSNQHNPAAASATNGHQNVSRSARATSLLVPNGSIARLESDGKERTEEMIDGLLSERMRIDMVGCLGFIPAVSTSLLLFSMGFNRIIIFLFRTEMIGWKAGKNLLTKMTD